MNSRMCSCASNVSVAALRIPHTARSTVCSCVVRRYGAVTRVLPARPSGGKTHTAG